MNRLLLVFCFLVSARLAFGIAGAPTYAEAIKDVARFGDGRQALIQQIAKATGLLVMMNEDPVVESQDQWKRNVLGLRAFEQEPCGAVYFKKPAEFVTVAHCLMGAEGSLDPLRRNAKVVFLGKAFTVDPLSIVIHEKHAGNSNPTQYDVAVFSILPEQKAEFDKLQITPLPLATADTGLSVGQRFYLASSGSTSANSEDWGTGRIKPFRLVTVPRQEETRGSSDLFVSPKEEILLFATDDGSVGINCLFDSGGAVVAETLAPDGSLQAMLVGNIVRKTGPEGNPRAECHQVRRYAIGTDLRYKQKWFTEALALAQQQRRQAEELRLKFTSLQEGIFGKNNPYALWVPVRKDTLDELFRTTQAVTVIEKSKHIFDFMLREKKRQDAIQFITMSSTHKMAVQNVLTLVQRPAENLRPMAVNQVEGVRNPSIKEPRYTNPNALIPVRSVRVTNLGDEPVSFDAIIVSSNHGRGEVTGKPTATVLKPGQNVTFPWPNNELKPVEYAELHGFSGDPTHLKVDMTIATKGEQMGMEWQKISTEYSQAVQEDSRLTKQYNADNASSKKKNQEYNNYQRDDWTNEYYRQYVRDLIRRSAAIDYYRAGYIQRQKDAIDAYNQKWGTRYGYFAN